jgi:hypothetical protein
MDGHDSRGHPEVPEVMIVSLLAAMPAAGGSTWITLPLAAGNSPVPGNRQLNAALHRIAVTQLRVHPPAQAYLLRLQAAGKSKREALRVLKRRLVRVVFNLLHADLDQARPAPSTALLPAHEPAA